MTAADLTPAELNWGAGGHGPDPCDGCGIYHTHVREHFDADGQCADDDGELFLLVIPTGMFDTDGAPLFRPADWPDPA